MNILMISPDYPPVYGGIGTHVDALVKELLQYQEIKVTVLVTRLKPATYFNSIEQDITIQVKERLTVIDIPDDYDIMMDNVSDDSVLNQKVARMWVELLPKVMRYLPVQRYDLIHSHDAYGSFVAVLLKDMWKIPLITTVHTMHASRSSVKFYLREFAAHCSDLNIAVSKFIQDKMMDLFQISSAKIKVIYNSVYIDEMQEKEKVIDVSMQEISFCGRFEEIKGCVELVECFYQLSKIVPADAVCLNLIGEGSLKPELEKMVDQYGLRKCVRFYHNISNQRVRELFRKSSIVVIPSKEEPFATVGLEAMAEKTAVICSDVGGMPEMVTHNITGYVYPSGNKAALFDALNNLINDQQKVLQFGKNGYHKVRELFEWSRTAAEIVKVYKHILQSWQLEE